MNFQLFTDYPSWFWLICILCGGLYASVLYFREKKINSAIANKWWLRALYALRFIAVMLIAFLLLNPYLKSKYNETEKPIVIIAQDNSSSLKDGIKDSAAYQQKLNALQDALSNTFDVRKYTFGETLKEGQATNNFDEKSTDISSALSELNNLYENLNVGAIIMATDGIYNTGSNPVYVKNDLGAPIYTIALGDTTPKKDIRIDRVLHNNIVYLNDKFTINTEIAAIFCKGNNPKISVVEIIGGNSKLLGEQSIAITDDNFSTSQQWELAANVPGIRHYQVRVASIAGEHTTANNVQDLFIEVLDARQKILILANAPHPDLNAIQQSIEANKNYEVTIQLASDIKGSIAAFDLVILHQLPSIKYPIAAVLSEIKSNQTGTFFIAGNQLSLNAFNKAQSLVTINSNGQSANEVTGIFQSTFNLFNLSEQAISLLPKLPALSAPYGQYTTSPASQVILSQKIGSVSTKTPLLIFSLSGSAKTAVLCGENIWKWRMYDFVLNNNQDAINELLSKTLQYLSTKNDKKQFRVNQSRSVLNENEPVVLDAELYNDSYELINEPDATLTIKAEDGKDYPFQFSKNNKSYVLQAGFFPAGNYTYKGAVVYNGKEFKDNGAFTISPVRLETINTTADHRILNQMAVESGGKMFGENEMAAIAELIQQQAGAKPVMREIVKTQSIINLKWIFFLVLGLLALEWFVRKFNGSY